MYVQSNAEVRRVSAVQYCLHCDTSTDVDLYCFIDVCGPTNSDFQILITEPKVKFGTIGWLSYYFKPPRNVRSEVSGWVVGGDALKTKTLRYYNKNLGARRGIRGRETLKTSSVSPAKIRMVIDVASYTLHLPKRPTDTCLRLQCCFGLVDRKFARCNVFSGLDGVLQTDDSVILRLFRTVYILKMSLWRISLVYRTS